MTAYDALHDSAAWLDISARGRLRASGEDHIRLLHALCSNQVENLAPGQGTDALFLNDRAHTHAGARLWRFDDHVLIDTQPDRRQRLFDTIDNAIIMDDVSLADVTAETCAFALEGPLAATLAAAVVDSPLPQTPHAHCAQSGVITLCETFTGAGGYWFILPQSAGDDFRGRLSASGAPEARDEDFRQVRIEHGIPALGEDYLETNLPQETQLMRAVSFSKGCYPGQEILERVRARGQVNRLLVAIELEAPQPPDEKEVVVNGKTMGTLTNAVYSDRCGKTLGFALLRREAAAEGTLLRVGAVAGRVAARTASGV